MKKFLFVLGALALLAEPVAAMPVYVSHRDAAAVGLQPTKVVTYAGAARQSPPQLLLSRLPQSLLPARWTPPKAATSGEPVNRLHPPQTPPQ
jgi:hypothetical protein